MSRGAGRMDAWSRRKARVAETEAAEARATEVAATEAAMADKTDAEICAELDLPDPDDLAPGDDFAAFLGREVPERLRRRALRKLWVSNPVLANVDGLVDYGEDFKKLQCPAGTVVATAYKVGRGFVKEQVGVKEQAGVKEQVAEPEGLAAEAGEVGPGTEFAADFEAGSKAARETAETRPAGDDMAPMGEAAPVPAAALTPALAAEMQGPSRASRRMRFAFDDDGTDQEREHV